MQMRIAVLVVFLQLCAAGVSRPFLHAITPGVNLDPTNPTGRPAAAAVQQVGAQLVRIEYKDSAPAGSPPSSFGQYDAIIKAYHTAGIQVLLILDYTSLPGRPVGSAPWGDFIKSFAQRCSDVAVHYKGLVEAYEIWNEPDLSHVGDVNATVYGPLLAASYTAIKAADSSATVVMGGLASGNPTYVAKARQAAGGKLPCDAIGIHPYGQRPFPNWPTPTWGFGVLPDLLQAYSQVDSTPLWITEIGTRDLSAQAQFPAKAFESVANSTQLASYSFNCRVVIWFCWSDGMIPSMGLLNASGAEKPDYFSYQAYAKSHLKDGR